MRKFNILIIMLIVLVFISLNKKNYIAEEGVVDTTPPIITATDIKLNVNESVNWLDYVQVVDDLDQFPTIMFDDSSVLINQVGVYSLKVTATDQSNNKATKEIQVYVVDEESPVIHVLDQFRVEVNTEKLNYLDYVSVVDNFDTNLEVVVNDTQVDITKLGCYTILFTAIDSHGNTGLKNSEVCVVDDTEPTLTIIKPLIILKETKNVDYSDYITVTDNYDLDISLNINDTLINYNKIGEYTIYFNAIDSSENEIDIMETVLIVSDEAPEIIGLKEWVIDVKSNHPNYLEGVTATSNYGKILNVSVDASNVMLDKTGTYVITYQAIDDVGNMREVKKNVYVVDKIKPELIGVKNRTIQLKDHFDPLLGIKAIDNYDGDITDQIEVVTDFSRNEKGIYTVSIIIMDQSGNITKESYTLVVEGNVDFYVPALVIGISGAILFGLNIALTIYRKFY